MASDSRTVGSLYPVTRVLWYVLDLIEFALLVRLVLLFLQANPAAQFSQFVFSITYPLVRPFLNVFPNYHVAGFTFEWASILAMIVYWIIAVAIINLIVLLIRSLQF